MNDETGNVGSREKLQKFVQRFAGRSRNEILADLKVPVLVQTTEPGPNPVPSAMPKFGTMSMNKEALVFGETGLYAFPLRKASTNAFAMMVTVGRAANNDIVLPYEGISKFHAYFSNTPQGWVIVDAKSTNGTYVNERRLQGDVKEKLDIEKGPIDLSFSSAIKCRLYAPRAFCDLALELLGIISPRRP